MNLRRSGLAAGVAGCALLSGCVHPFKDAIVDPRSPVAAEVVKTVRPDAPYPTFVDFPKKPTGLRPTRQYGRDADRVNADAAKLIAATADSTWTLKDTDAFAAQARADAGPVLPPVQPGDTEAFARDLKARATPPPPVKR
ncbi:hypothetical protein [Phenylobacterium sp.]|uniref:hypothetical protein n=1 Tax=Phenylobacterium sp. TaxID=1871053 RepID=UPI002E315B38|nr:hypothetical protein [Phenylobacterium sp.]HEX3365831.1 hypothetical protein [Phenylobacterium sp.]